MSGFRHNKKRNVALVYEFLVRRMTTQMVEQDLKGYRQTAPIVRKYFSPGQPLARELELYEAVRSSRGISATIARRILRQIAHHATKLNRRLSETRKDDLIDDVNRTFGKDFFSEHHIPEYGLLASICVYLDPSGSALRENIQKIKLEESLVKYMSSSSSVAPPQRSEKEVDGLVAAMAAKKFQERYGTFLSESQRILLGRYMLLTASERTDALSTHLDDECSRLSEILSRASSLREFGDDKVMKERLGEAYRRLSEEVPGMDLDEKVQEIMLYYKLEEELASDE